MFPTAIDGVTSWGVNADLNTACMPHTCKRERERERKRSEQKNVKDNRQNK